MHPLLSCDMPQNICRGVPIRKGGFRILRNSTGKARKTLEFMAEARCERWQADHPDQARNCHSVKKRPRLRAAGGEGRCREDRAEWPDKGFANRGTRREDGLQSELHPPAPYRSAGQQKSLAKGPAFWRLIGLNLADSLIAPLCGRATFISAHMNSLPPWARSGMGVVRIAGADHAPGPGSRYQGIVRCVRSGSARSRAVSTRSQGRSRPLSSQYPGNFRRRD